MCALHTEYPQLHTIHVTQATTSGLTRAEETESRTTLEHGIITH